MRVNATRFVILGLLTDGPMAGYDIKKLVDLRFRFFWNESFGQIYPELKKLTQEGLVELLPPDPSEGGRPKKTYEITPVGEESFREWMAVAPDGEWTRNEFLLKVFWAPFASPDRVKNYIHDFRNRHANDLEVLRKMESEMQGIVGEHANHWWILQTIRLGRRVNEAYVGWAAEMLSSMEGMRDEE